MKRAAVLLIGDELLTGKFQDENGAYAIKRFRESGVSLAYVAIIPDVLETISEQVRRCSDAFDIVVTSGGVGPTHDDVTLEGVARAFEVPVVERPELMAALEAFGWEISEAVMRMVRIPEGAALNWLEGVRYPAIQMRNVHILPGVPTIFRMKFDALLPQWASTPLCTSRVYVNERESAIAQRLSEVVERHPNVAIGSYPRFGETEFKVIVTLEGPDADDVRRARNDVEGCMITIKPKQE